MSAPPPMPVSPTTMPMPKQAATSAGSKLTAVPFDPAALREVVDDQLGRLLAAEDARVDAHVGVDRHVVR